MATSPEASLERNAASESLTMRGVREILYGSVRTDCELYRPIHDSLKPLVCWDGLQGFRTSIRLDQSKTTSPSTRRYAAVSRAH